MQKQEQRNKGYKAFLEEQGMSCCKLCRKWLPRERFERDICNLCRGVAALLVLLIVLPFSSAVCGDGVCDGRTSYADPDSGLGFENWDSCPSDCSRTFNERPTWVTYHDNDEIQALMSGLIKDFPGLIREEVFGESIEGRPIKAYLIGPGFGGFFFDGRLHGVEDCGTESGLQFVRWVLMSPSAQAADLRQNSSLIFMPIVNPDSSGRQNNRRLYPDGTRVPYGVDLNRNFPRGWGTAGSSNPSDPYEYMGQGPASEPETRAVMEVIERYDPRVYFNVHCGMALASGGGNTSISSFMVSVMRNESAKLDNALFSQLNPHYSSSCGSGGYSKAEACDSNTSSWLVEVAEWGDLPATLEAYHDKYWHNVWPLYYSGALAARVSPASFPLQPEPPQDLVEPDAPPVVDSPVGREISTVLGQARASLSVSQESVTSGSDRDVLIMNAVLPLKEIVPWLGLVLFLGLAGMAFVGFSGLGGAR